MAEAEERHSNAGMNAGLRPSELVWIEWRQGQCWVYFIVVVYFIFGIECARVNNL